MDDRPDAETGRRGEDWYRAVYEAHAHEVLAYFLRRRPPDHAPDLLAEVFLVAWRRRAVAPDAPELRPWLYRTARNVLRNHRRGEARRYRLFERLTGYVDPWIDADDRSDTADRDATVRRALHRLRPVDREILRLSAWEECSNAEIADVLGCSTNAVAIRLHRARRRLRRQLTSVARPALPDNPDAAGSRALFSVRPAGGDDHV